VSLYSFAKHLLFKLEPERAHLLGLKFMRFLGDMCIDESSLRVRTSLGELNNVIGLAGGFDKEGKYLKSLEKLGFGYLVVGTVTRTPWPGHPKPRIVRNPKEKTLVNCLGFPNSGVDDFIRNISRQKTRVPIVGSISGQTISDIIECYQKLQPHVSGIELNLSSPNTAKLRDLREAEAFTELATEMVTFKLRPTYLKIPPYIDDSQFRQVLQLVKVWDNLGFEGVTACNTIPISDSRLSVGTGGFSGPPLFQGMLKAIRAIRAILPSDLEINAVGGISNAHDVTTALKEGATTVQMYTALVFEGPTVIHGILKELAASS